MDKNTIILLLSIATKDAINFLKTHQCYTISKRLHGAKKILMRILSEQYKTVSCQRVLQFNPEKNPNSNIGHCMVKFVYEINNNIVSFHIPIDKITWEYKLTTDKVSILQHKLPADFDTTFTSSDEIENLIKILHALQHLDFPTSTRKRIEAYVKEYANKLFYKKALINKSTWK